MAQGTAEAAAAAESGAAKHLLFRWRGWGVIALGAALLLAHWLILGPPSPRLWFALAALPLVLLGACFRVWARCYFTRGSDTRRIQAHRLVIAGPYRRVRNPLYVGNMAVAVGLALGFLGPWSAAALLLALIVLYSGVIRSEETILGQTWGASYADFRRQVPRWIPRLVPLPADPESPAPELGHALKKEARRIAGALAAWGLALVLVLSSG